MLKNENKWVTADHPIIKMVRNYTGVQDLTVKSRKREVVEARQIAMSFLRWNTTLSLQAIGELFNRNYATVLHACKTIQNLIDTDKVFIKQYSKLLEELEML